MHAELTASRPPLALNPLHVCQRESTLTAELTIGQARARTGSPWLEEDVVLQDGIGCQFFFCPREAELLM